MDAKCILGYFAVSSLDAFWIKWAVGQNIGVFLWFPRTHKNKSTDKYTYWKTAIVLSFSSSHTAESWFSFFPGYCLPVYPLSHLVLSISALSVCQFWLSMLHAIQFGDLSSSKIKVFCLKSEASWFHHHKNTSSIIWKRLGVELLLLHMERCQLRWFGHLVRMFGSTDPGHDGAVIFFVWPRNALVFHQRRCRRWLRKERFGPHWLGLGLGLGYCSCDSDLEEQNLMDGWMKIFNWEFNDFLKGKKILKEDVKCWNVGKCFGQNKTETPKNIFWTWSITPFFSQLLLVLE